MLKLAICLYHFNKIRRNQSFVAVDFPLPPPALVHVRDEDDVASHKRKFAVVCSFVRIECLGLKVKEREEEKNFFSSRV